MPWHIARVAGRETRACLYLSRAGIRNFRPVEHHYFIDRRTKVERYRERPRFGGYVFVELHSAAERDAACNAIGVAGLLGWWTDDGYRLATIPTHYVTDLMDAGPVVLNKVNTKGRFRHGQKVKMALGALAEIIGEFQELDKKGLNVVKGVLFGKEQRFHLPDARLEAAE
jgi:transcription antitermination factor NusG